MDTETIQVLNKKLNPFSKWNKSVVVNPYSERCFSK
uniref:Uncharacterized protein n=1 Tax=Arundo donax TaxID=35708 RepID=A0A0A9BG42_ARUDO